MRKGRRDHDGKRRRNGEGRPRRRGGILRWLGVWRAIDDRLRAISDSLQRFVRTLRLLRAFLALAIVVVLASGVVAIAYPPAFPYVYAAAVLFLSIPLALLLALVALPLRAKSMVRLIDKGYPANAKELAIRIAARKLHEESIETEEMLVETAVRESRKVLSRYRERAQRVRQALERDDGEREPVRARRRGR